MSRPIVLLVVLAAAQLCFGQEARTTIRVGDAFRGPIKLVRTEVVRVRMEGDKEIEGLRGVIQVVTYSPDGRTKETIQQDPNGTLRRKIVETYFPSGTQESLTIYDGSRNQISKVTYEHDKQGAVALETRHNTDGSVQGQTFVQTERATDGSMVAVNKVSNAGYTIETSINSRPAPKVSKWSTTKPDGSRHDNIFSIDAAGDHNDEIITYKADGSLTGRRVSRVNHDITRLEATEYDANGAVIRKTLETREYDSLRNITAVVNYKWNAALEKFEPVARTYHHIEYFE